MASKSMHDLFVNQIQDAYCAETQLTNALTGMARAATDPDLRAGFERHLAETEGQVERLEQIGSELNIGLDSDAPGAMGALIEEGRAVMGLGLEGEVQDAGLIAAAQKVEHYEIAMYGCLCTWAEELGYATARALLHESLEEEKRTNDRLTDLAKSRVNQEAAAR